MTEFRPDVRKYVERALRVPVIPPESLDEPHSEDSELDAKYAPYVEAHGQLERFAVGEAFRTLLRDTELTDSNLELGIPTKDKSVGSSITLRWGKQAVQSGVEVSDGIRVDLRDKTLRLSYMSGSTRPNKETLAQMSEVRRGLVEEQVKPGGFRTLLEFDAEVMKLDPSALAVWMGVAKNASKPYFDYSSSSRQSSDQYVDAKRFSYEVDPDDEQVYINFET